MVENMKESGKIIIDMVVAHYKLRTTMNMSDSLRITKEKDKECALISMEVDMKVIGSII